MAALHLSADPMIAASQRFDHYSAEARTFRRCAGNAASINNRGAFVHFQREARRAAGEARAALCALCPAPVDNGGALAMVMEAMGWTVQALDVDTSFGRAVVLLEVSRGDMLVTFHAEGHLGRASVTRESARWNEWALGAGYGYNGRWERRLLGRQRYANPKEAIGDLGAYLADNGQVPAMVGATRNLLMGLVAA